jgi:hypothetical protein
MSSSLLLMNCRRCDDVVKLVEKERACECGLARGKETDAGEVTVTGSVRVFTITWEAYDGIEEGESRGFGVLPRAQYRGRGA